MHDDDTEFEYDDSGIIIEVIADEHNPEIKDGIVYFDCKFNGQVAVGSATMENYALIMEGFIFQGERLQIKISSERVLSL